MATNRNATVRYVALDQCFRNPGRKYFMEDLIAVCNNSLLDLDPESSGVKRRQVFEDIKFMKDSRGFEAPIESYKEGRKAYYRYSDINFSINSQPLNEQEAQQLKESLLTLSRFKGLPQFDWVEELKARLEQTFKLGAEDNIISFEENPFLTGREYIGEIYNAVVNKKVLIISYKPYKNKQELRFDLHPYHLKQYNNRWFLFGLNNEYNNLTTVALDRILEIQESKLNYIQNTTIDFSEHFDDVIGVSINPDQNTQKVLLKIHPELAPYVSSKPIHGSQIIRMNDSQYPTMELFLQINYEFESLIMSFGEKVEVLQPTVLREKIISRITQMQERYF
ncbi:helix-turn-helix transcriptional regulator [Saccharicrinis aurantiacus]|uniref:helix-turn-helix transcriptional regulator n=1 Tax=Saccharicrinis aurantiacus TaxID=1849719 RepID=UPI00083927BC|nr:WYL domain-containing protein [Saccharicrinis aurantiacus]